MCAVGAFENRSLAKVAKHLGMTLDELVNFKGKVPTEEKIEDKTTMEQVKLINGLHEEDKAMVFRLIDTIVTKKEVQRFCGHHAINTNAAHGAAFQESVTCTSRKVLRHIQRHQKSDF